MDRIGKTWVFNPGRQNGAFPTYIALDLDTMTAEWISAEGQSRARRYCGACAAMLFYLWPHPHILALLLLLCIWIAQAMCAPALIGERFECGTFTARVS